MFLYNLVVYDRGQFSMLQREDCYEKKKKIGINTTKLCDVFHFQI